MKLRIREEHRKHLKKSFWIKENFLNFEMFMVLLGLAFIVYIIFTWVTLTP